MADDAEDKTEEPSGRKLAKAREDGKIARSGDFNSAVVLLAGIAALSFFGADFVNSCSQLMRNSFLSFSQAYDLSDQWLSHLGADTLMFTLRILLPILLVLMLAGLTVNLLQVGLIFTTKPLEIDLSKLFNWKVILSLFGKQAWVELLKGLAKMFAVGYMVYDTIAGHFGQILSSMDMDLISISNLIVAIAFEMLWKVVLLLLLIGLVDWLYQKHRTHEQLKMTKQEVKEETKNTLGDPKIIAARRRAMFKMHKKFMMRDVPKATVVITNPTFIAIAIRYRRGLDQSPVVLAKGKRLIAERIRTIAKENGIPVVENKPLARAMYDEVKIGEAIPQEFYAGVAEVLAYVFSMGQRKAAFA
ncbi:MAG TPA: flagellar biosynthesis protein FlhB [Fibrobacteraceae bacterium]|nr:flagellar biosynthesis protein FlhB [Fibrobacteraceae bacterium]